jgi:hypothetical protein
MEDKQFKKEISRVRSEVRKVSEQLSARKAANPFTGAVAQGYWSATGMPWVASDGRKGVLTEWFWQPISLL